MSRKSKKNDKKRSTRKTGTKKSRKSTTKKDEESEKDFFTSWMKFQEDLGTQIGEVIERQQAFHKDLNTKWSEMSDDMTERINKALPTDDSVKDLQGLWERYIKNMNKNMERFMESETQAFDTLHERWKPLSEEMNKVVLDLGKSKDVRSSQMKLIDSWIKISQEMTEQMSRSIETGGKEFKDLRGTWNDLMEDLNKMTIKLQESQSSTEVGDSIKTLAETTRKINELFIDQLDTDMVELTRRQDFWLRTMSDMSTGFVKAMWDMNLKLLEEGQRDVTNKRRR
jgi:methyl-accepting chemotaxis protein